MPFTSELIALLKRRDYAPLKLPELAEALEIPAEEREDFEKEVRDLQKQGTIVRLKGDRLCLPRDADLVTGKIWMRQSGSANLFPDPDPEKEGPAPEPIHVRAEDTWVARHNDRVLARLQHPRGGKNKHKKGRGGKRDRFADETTARVIRILERARETITGTLKKSRIHYYVIPDDPRIIQDILVPDPELTKLNPKPKVDDKVIVKLAPWEQRHLNPEGEIQEVLGKTHHPGSEYRALLHLFDLDPEFPDTVMEEVEDLPDSVSANARKGRRDLRKLHTFTIDPDDAKDFDDALSVERLEDGRMRVGIHIADVSYYVKDGTALDEEARKRGNSTYLVGRVIPMLPHKLSNGLCSLVEAEDRLTKSVFITFSKNGRLIEGETEFANTVICSDKRLTYRQAYALLFEDDLAAIRAMPLPPAHQTGSTGKALNEMSDRQLGALQRDVRTLWDLASKMRKKRMTRGSLDLDMPETKIFVDKEGYADRIEKIENDESHQLIEEFMLAANENVARVMRQQNFPLIHRVHDKPDAPKLKELGEHLGTFDIYAGDLSNRRHMSQALRLIREHPQSHVLRIAVLRSLKQACYRASADGHYGLAKQNYTHFTSPIRRYSDLIVHRVFDSFLAKQGDPTAHKKPLHYTVGQLNSLAQHVSITEQNSTEAERESIKLKLLEFFEREVNKPENAQQVFQAVIVDVKNHGMFVELTESLAYGLVHISTLKDDLYNLNGDGTKLIGRRTKKRISLGDKVRVVAHRVDRFKRQIDFRITSRPLTTESKSTARPHSGGAKSKKKAASKKSASKKSAQQKKQPTKKAAKKSTAKKAPRKTTKKAATKKKSAPKRPSRKMPQRKRSTRNR